MNIVLSQSQKINVNYTISIIFCFGNLFLRGNVKHFKFNYVLDERSS